MCIEARYLNGVLGEARCWRAPSQSEVRIPLANLHRNRKPKSHLKNSNYTRQNEMATALPIWISRNLAVAVGIPVTHICIKIRIAVFRCTSHKRRHRGKWLPARIDRQVPYLESVMSVVWPVTTREYSPSHKKSGFHLKHLRESARFTWSLGPDHTTGEPELTVQQMPRLQAGGPPLANSPTWTGSDSGSEGRFKPN